MEGKKLVKKQSIFFEIAIIKVLRTFNVAISQTEANSFLTNSKFRTFSNMLLKKFFKIF
jgi:hypothetical protein